MLDKLGLGYALSAPFSRLGNAVDNTAGHALVDLAFGAAICGLLFVAIAFSVGGNRMRQVAKSHLLWIFAGIAIAAGVGGIVSWMRGVGGNDVFKNGTILPAIHNALPFK